MLLEVRPGAPGAPEKWQCYGNLWVIVQAECSNKKSGTLAGTTVKGFDLLKRQWPLLRLRSPSPSEFLVNTGLWVHPGGG